MTKEQIKQLHNEIEGIKEKEDFNKKNHIISIDIENKEETNAANYLIRKVDYGDIEKAIKEKRDWIKTITNSDPDSHSKELYEDWEKFIKSQLKIPKNKSLLTNDGILFFEKLSPHKKRRKLSNPEEGECRLLSSDLANFNGSKYSGAKWVISSDYIGASVSWAKKAGVDSERFYEHLKIARLLGGHMLFPKSKSGTSTINQARGWLPYCDRFDLALLDIKRYFTSKLEHSERKKLKAAINNYNYYFDLFGEGLNGFKNFIDFFELNEFVRKDSLDIINLLCSNFKNEKIKYLSHDSDITPSAILEKNNYERYMTNLEILILNRTKKMLKIISKE